MSELTKEASEARDFAVRRTLELLRGDEVLNTPTRPGAVAETFEERAAVLCHAMHMMCFDMTTYFHGIPPSEIEYKEAIVWLEALTAATWEETPENLCLRALAMHALAESRRQLGNVPGCLAALREAAELAANAGPELEGELCRMLLNLSHILAEKGAKEESIPVAKEAARVAAGMKSENLSYGCYALRELSQILSKIGVLDESLNVATKAVGIAENIDGMSYDNDVPELPGTLMHLAEVHHLRGELTAAEAALHRAKDIWESRPPRGRWDEVGSCLHKLASIREDMGDIAGSIAFRREAVDFWRRQVVMDNSESPFHLGELALSLGNLGMALASDHQWLNACFALEEAYVRYDSLSKWENPEAPGFAAKLDECRAALWEEKNS